MRINTERMDAVLLAIAEGRRGLGAVKMCKRCHRRHPARMSCEDGREFEQQQLERERPQ